MWGTHPERHPPTLRPSQCRRRDTPRPRPTTRGRPQPRHPRLPAAAPPQSPPRTGGSLPCACRLRMMSAWGGSRYRLSIYARGDGDEGCPRVWRGTEATEAAPARSRALQTCRRTKGSRWACMVGWPGREAEPGPYILGLPSRPAPPYLPGGSFKILYTPPTHTLGGVPQREPLLGRAGPEPGREEAHQAPGGTQRSMDHLVCQVWAPWRSRCYSPDRAGLWPANSQVRVVASVLHSPGIPALSCPSSLQKLCLAQQGAGREWRWTHRGL